MKAIQIDSTTKDKEKYGNLPKLHEQKAREMDADQETQEVLESGQESKKKGEKVVKQLETIKQESKKRQADDILNRLEMRRQRIGSYKEALAEGLVAYLKMLDWPRGWVADVVLTDGRPIKILGKGFKTQNGILLVVTTPDGRVFHQGILTTRNPVLDYSSMMTLAIQTENQLDRERKVLLDGSPQRTNLPDKYLIKGAPPPEKKETASGIHLPNR